MKLSKKRKALFTRWALDRIAQLEALNKALQLRLAPSQGHTFKPSRLGAIGDDPAVTSEAADLKKPYFIAYKDMTGETRMAIEQLSADLNKEREKNKLYESVITERINTLFDLIDWNKVSGDALSVANSIRPIIGRE